MDVIKDRYYAGVGPRDIGIHQGDRAKIVAKQMAALGFILNTGGAIGMDDSFEKGCKLVNGRRQIFIPWDGFEQRLRNVVIQKYHIDNIHVFGYDENLLETLTELVFKHHPAANDLSPGMFKLMMRNCHQVLGRDLKTPVECTLTDARALKFDNDNNICDCRGGTGFAVRLSYANGIPVYNLSTERHRRLLTEKYNIRF